MDIDLPWYYYN